MASRCRAWRWYPARREAREEAGSPRWTDPKKGNRDVVPHGFRPSFRDWVSAIAVTLRSAEWLILVSAGAEDQAYSHF
jgi:hypothetical protein